MLNKKDILERMYHPKSEKEKLIVTPILDEDTQIDGPGIDLRLSNQFIIFKPENISKIDICSLDEKEVRKVQSHVVVPFGQSFILHPKTLVLAASLEYVSMPNNVSGTIDGRSSWSRLGLIIATASTIDPGYKGCVTLELTNLGNLPLYLYPGIRIAKLKLYDTLSESEYNIAKRKYFCQIGPEFTQGHSDDDLKILKRIFDLEKSR